VSSISPDAGAAGPGAAEPPAAEPPAADGGSVGVVVPLGFTGSPQTIRDWASSLAAAGLTARGPLLTARGPLLTGRGPLLTGRGGTWQELAKTGRSA
jgi:carboxylesterase